MKVEIKNIGKVKKASIDLSKNLIVFTGKNNSGKTWVSYVLYAFLGKFFVTGENINRKKYFNSGLLQDLSLNNPTKELIFNKLELFKYFNLILKESVKNSLPNVFANSKIDFSTFSMNVEDFIVNEKRLLILDIGDKKFVFFEFQFIEENIIVKLKYFEGNMFDNLSERLLNKYEEVQINNRAINDLNIFSWFLSSNSVNFIPAERVGISVFSTEISANRMINSNSIQYQLPIREALSDWVKIPNLINRSNDSVFTEIAKEIEKDILGGNLVFGDGGSIHYEIDELRNLSYLNTASNIKSLSHLIFYLKYYAIEGGILFIDEPEINLHPNNQRKIAKYLAKISNLGIKVIVSTHSDYVIREFNNLIMLSKKHKETNKLLNEFGYSKKEILEKNNVGAYYFDNNKVDELEVSETGFEVLSIDETIEIQNKIANNLFFKLFDA